MKITSNPSLLSLLQGAGDQPRASQAAARDQSAQNARQGGRAAKAQSFEALPLRQAQTSEPTKSFAREAPLAGRAPKYIAPGQQLNILV